jgi:hypothetical protein
VTRDVQTFMEASLKSDRAEELYTLIRQNAMPKIENLLFSLLMKPLGDKNIHIEVSWENATGEDIQLAKDARENRDTRDSGGQDSLQVNLAQPEPQEFDVEEGAVVLDVDLILAPVSGIPIYELAPGDKIMIKINPSTNRGRYFIDLLNAMHENEVVPVPGTVNEVKLNKFNEYTILVKIGEGIYGKAIETEQVKLKRFDPVADRKSSSAAAKGLSAAGFGAPSANAAAEDKSIKSLYWLMYLGGFVVLAAILFIALSVL